MSQLKQPKLTIERDPDTELLAYTLIDDFDYAWGDHASSCQPGFPTMEQLFPPGHGKRSTLHLIHLS